MKGSLTLPVGESPRVPEEVGHYLCWERGSPRILVIYWGPGSRDWRLGSGLIHVQNFAGPIPQRRYQPL